MERYKSRFNEEIDGDWDEFSMLINKSNIIYLEEITTGNTFIDFKRGNFKTNEKLVKPQEIIINFDMTPLKISKSDFKYFKNPVSTHTTIVLKNNTIIEIVHNF